MVARYLRFLLSAKWPPFLLLSFPYHNWAVEVTRSVEFNLFRNDIDASSVCYLFKLMGVLAIFEALLQTEPSISLNHWWVLHEGSQSVSTIPQLLLMESHRFDLSP